MIKFISISITTILIGLSSVYAVHSIWRGETLSASKAQKRWGNQTYTSESFKKSDFTERAKMAASVLQDKSLKGLTVTEVRNKFGAPDGFYFIDSYPAYIIQDGKTRDEETWQIVFLLNASHKVREVIVHKNCCEKK